MNVKKNKDERRAKRYLQTLKHAKLEYEPLGNVTPDFLIDNKIAVEVRRLNRNYINGEQQLRVENLEIPLIKNIKKMIEVFKSASYENSTYVSLTLYKSLELDNKADILNKIEKILYTHTKHISEQKTYTINDNLEITFTPTDKKPSIYIYTGCNDDLFWIVNQLHKNIQSAIDEKDKKIKQNFGLYDRWWLILVDSIIYGLDDEDFKKLKHIRPNKRKFEKVIILSPKGDLRVLKF